MTDLETFAKAFTQALALADISQRAMAARIGVAQSTLAAWAVAGAEPPRPMVFALEEELGIEPGELSSLLGYLPVGTRPVRQDVEAALRADTALSAGAKQAMVTLYRELGGGKRRR